MARERLNLEGTSGGPQMSPHFRAGLVSKPNQGARGLVQLSVGYPWVWRGPSTTTGIFMSKCDACSSVLWSFHRMALCTWLISILLFSMPILLYGGYMLLLTAALMLFSLLFFITARNTPKCPIQFGRASLKTDYGGSFWLTLATGGCSACYWGFCCSSLQQ